MIGTPDPAQVVVQLGPGWLPAGQGPPGSTGRWADQGADIWITAFQPETVALEITAAALCGATPGAGATQRRAAHDLERGHYLRRLPDRQLPHPGGRLPPDPGERYPGGALPGPTPFDKTRPAPFCRRPRSGWWTCDPRRNN